jgi:hypothetical protein
MRVKHCSVALLAALVFAPVMLVAEPVPKENVVAAEPQPAAPDSVVVVTIAARHVAVDSAIQIQSTDVPRAPVRAPLSMSVVALGAIAGTVRAKVRCSSKTKNEGFDGTAFRFDAVYSSDPGSENKSFTDATPALSLNMTISDGKPAADQFEEGKEYYLDFTPAE